MLNQQAAVSTKEFVKKLTNEQIVFILQIFDDYNTAHFEDVLIEVAKSRGINNRR